MTIAPMLDVKNLKVQFEVKERSNWLWPKKSTVKAVDDVSFSVFPGETLGVVGESGCGKSTLARAIIGLVKATSGSIVWQGQELVGLPEKERRATREQLQLIFQDPLASLDPRMTIGEAIAEPLRAFYPKLRRAAIIQEVKRTLDLVGLSATQINHYPHELSGGQCQRVGIARALILKPKLIICDEPVSALDISIQAQIVNLFQDLKQELDLSLIFVSHDLSIVKHICDRVMVMYLGKVMELSTKEALYRSPQHPYTQGLLSAVPNFNDYKNSKKKLALLEGDLPSPIAPPSGCVFRTRCPKAIATCAEMVPELLEVTPDSKAACSRLFEYRSAA